MPPALYKSAPWKHQISPNGARQIGKLLQTLLPRLLNAAEEAKEMAISALNHTASFMLVVDCVSRYLFYGDRFTDEIEAIKVDGVPTFGFLSMGEIANTGNDFMQLHNKTCVVGLMKEG